MPGCLCLSPISAGVFSLLGPCWMLTLTMGPASRQTIYVFLLGFTQMGQ